MDKNENHNTSTTLQSLLPSDRKFLLDDEQKVGQIKFTADEKRELLKLTTSKGWEIVKGVYAKQRAVQIAVACVNVAQNVEGLMFYKGEASETDRFIKEIEKAAKELRAEEDAKNKPQST